MNQAQQPPGDNTDAASAATTRWTAARRAMKLVKGLLASPTLLTLVGFLGIRATLVEARYIPSGSMLPELQIQDRLLVEKVSKHRGFPRRGDILVFNSPYRFSRIGAGLPDPFPGQCALASVPLLSVGFQHRKCDAYIKRVVGLPGEVVRIDRSGAVWINGQWLDEPYVRNWCSPQQPCSPLTIKVSPGAVLVLGDNRPNSQDSRFWGALPSDEIIGTARFRFWPPGQFGNLPEAYSDLAQQDR